MAQKITTIDELRDYLRRVMHRADHHADDVNEVVLAIAGGVVWSKDDKPLEVYTRQGEMTNVLWFSVNGKRYALSYDHEEGEIDLRRGGTHGSNIGSFSNETTNEAIRTILDDL